MKRVSFILCIALAAVSFQVQAQSPAGDPADPDNGYSRNLLKVNVSALFVKNYSLQYERILSRSAGIALSFRTMPTTSLPLKGLILDLADDDPDTKDVLDKLRLSNFAITPEFRWYVGKHGYGRGFYIAPYYRYAKFKSNEVIFEFDNKTESITLRGDHSSHTGGILLGAQWFLGKNLCLDWWIVGAHLGSGNGNFSGTTDHTLTPQEQNSLRQALEDVDLPFGDKQVTVTANSANYKQTGLWFGARAGLSLGFRF